MISIDDFAKVEIKIGKIISAEKIPNADKLLKLMVDFGAIEVAGIEKNPVELSDAGTVKEEVAEILSDKISATVDPITSLEPKPDIRQIVSGIALYFPEPEKLVGKMCTFVTNLEPRKLKGFESNGMIMASSGPTGFSLLEPTGNAQPGDRVK